MEYTFGIEGLDAAIGPIPPGTNIMLIGPPMIGKSFLSRTFMFNGLKDNEAGIYVSTKETGIKIQEWYEKNGMNLSEFEDHYGIVDCLSKTLRMDIGETPKNVVEVASAVDMTGISIGVNQFLDDFWRTKQIKKVRVIVESLSNLLMYSNLQTVFRFLHVFTARLKAMDAVGVYTVEEGMHDPATITTLKQLVQVIIEMKEEDNEKCLKVTGLTPAPTDWCGYQIDANKIDVSPPVTKYKQTFY